MPPNLAKRAVVLLLYKNSSHPPHYIAISVQLQS